jgi:uncharacterized protein YfiM (DUF2279 family)
VKHLAKVLAALFLLTLTIGTAQAQPSPQTPAQLRADMLHAPAAVVVPESPVRAPSAWQQQDQDAADPWFAMDKAKHVAVAFLWTVGTQYALEDKFALSDRQALPFSVASGTGISFVKEFHDWQYTTGLFSRRDLVADAVGIGAAAAFIWL